VVKRDRILRYAIVLTYECNAKCSGCNRFLDCAPWLDTELSIEDLQEGYKRAIEKGPEFEKVRVTGGEPLLHPKFEQCMEVINKTWNKDFTGRTCVFSNGIIKGPDRPEEWRYRTADKKARKEDFLPSMISPYDSRWSVKLGVEADCPRQCGCGRLFDCHGFTFCIYAGVIGRLFGIDPYSPVPVLRGNPEICKHCVFSQGIKGAFKLFTRAKRGRIQPPTKSYAKALERGKKEGFPVFKKFSER